MPFSSSPPKRPRLSLQIKTPAAAVTLGKSTTALKSDIDPKSPTAFNTLSNAYAVAIENSSPLTAKPAGIAIKISKPTSLRLETKNFEGDHGYIPPSQRTQTPNPFSITYPDTPSSAIPSLTPTTAHPYTEVDGRPSATSFTFTPPQSAGSDRSMSQVFTFAANDNTGSPNTPRATSRRRLMSGSQVAPYTHPRSLHSILRNSPLPARTAVTPMTPSRSSMRLANRAAKKVGYNDPLTQTITTNKYVRSHIDLLAEDSPWSATDPEGDKIEILDVAMAYTGDETRDGGQTPGPFEEMRRRMAESDLATPKTRRQKKKEKKRKWEWTISNTDGETEEQVEPAGRTPMTALKFQKTPITAIRRSVSVASEDSEASEAEDRYAASLSEDSEMSEREDWNGVSSGTHSWDGSDGRPHGSQSL